MVSYYVEHFGAAYSITAYGLEHLLCGFVSEEEALDAKFWAESAKVGEQYRGSCYTVEVVEETL